MATGFFVDPVFYNIGRGDLLNSFFSTIFIRLEQAGWGSRFPLLMNDLYTGTLEKNNAAMAAEELQIIRNELSKYPPDEVVWDFEDLSSSPPWGKNISPEIMNLSEYFTTADGKNLIDVLFEALAATGELDEDLVIRVI